MENVKKIRTLLKIKQFELAKQVGISQANFANIENGKLIPNNIKEIEIRCLKIMNLDFINLIGKEKVKLDNIKELYNQNYD